MLKKGLMSLAFVFLLAGTSSAVTVFKDDMESGVNGWIATGLWHQAGLGDSCPNANSGSGSWYYGNSSCNYDTGVANSGSLTSPSISIPSAATVAIISFFYYYQTETAGLVFDQRFIQVSVDGGPFTNITQLSGDPMLTWQQKILDLSAYRGHSVQIRFFFNTVDNILNDFKGWYIDDVLVYTVGNGNAGPGPYSIFSRATFSWIDIADPANDTGINGDDFSGNVPIGFTFNYFGVPFNAINVSTNGYMTFGPNGTVFTNADIPNSAVPNNYIAPFWDDLYVFSSKGGKIYAKTIGTAPSRQFVVSWENVDFYPTQDSGKLYFQAILSEADLSITFQYKDMVSVDPNRGSGNSATIGLENGTGMDGVKYSFNTISVSNGLAITAPPLDSDGDGVPDITELLIGTNPAVNNGPTTITAAGPGIPFGTAYFTFNVVGPIDPATQGFRVYYGPASGTTINDYVAHFDINSVASPQSAYIDQKWGMQGVPVVYFRVAPFSIVNGREFIGAPSNELSTYFAGSKDSNGNDGAAYGVQTTTSSSTTRCFIATAAYGSPFEKHVALLRAFRDQYLITNSAGRWFVETYYQYSPPIAEFISRHEWAKAVTRTALLPAVGLSYFMVDASIPFRLSTVLAFFMLFVWLGVIYKKTRSSTK